MLRRDTCRDVKPIHSAPRYLLGAFERLLGVRGAADPAREPAAMPAFAVVACRILGVAVVIVAIWEFTALTGF